MPNKVHARWLNGKAALEKQIEFFKRRGSANAKLLEDVLKTFDQDLGSHLEKVGKAIAAKKNADIKSEAKTALAIAERYHKTISAISGRFALEERVQTAKQEIEYVIGALKSAEQLGAETRQETWA
jgi:hypothetical protein